MKSNIICAACGTTGEPKKSTRGSFLIELVLWLCLIVPGLIYSLWRLTTRHRVCRSCGSTDLIPQNTPRGRELSTRYHGATATMALLAVLLAGCVTPKMTHTPTNAVNFKAFRSVTYSVRAADGIELGSDPSYGRETIDLVDTLLGKRLATMGYTVVPEGGEMRIDVAVTAAKPGSGAARFWIGMGAGRAVFLFDTSVFAAGGKIAGFQGGRSYTGMEFNTPVFPGKDELSLMAATRSVSQIEEFIANNGRLPSQRR